jgi:acetoin utilization protein AcuB
MKKAEDLMTAHPATVLATSPVREAVQMLQSLDIRHLPVVDEEGALVGMLSDRDLRALELPTFVGDEYVLTVRKALGAPVSSLMTTDVVSVDTEADVAEVIDLMLDNKIGAVPVVDADGELVGIISYVDILRELPIDAAAAE